jgi:hypothetical protein
MRRALVPLIAIVVYLAIAPAAFRSALDLAKDTAGPDQIRLGGATYSSSGGVTSRIAKFAVKK